MSTYTYYQAIPERSRLLQRLRGEEKFRSLYTHLVLHGPGPFYLEAMEPDELDDILYGVAEWELFGSRAEVDRCLDDITRELDEAVTLHPGLKGRAAYIEKQHREIEELLAQELNRRGREDAAGLMMELLYGGDLLAPEAADRDDLRLCLVPASSIAKGAKLLAGIELPGEAQDIGDCEQGQGWKCLIIEAAGLGEAILVLPLA